MNKIIKSSIIVMIVLSFIMSITSCAKRKEAYNYITISPEVPSNYTFPYPRPELPPLEIQEDILSLYNNLYEQGNDKTDTFKAFVYYGEFNGAHVLLQIGQAMYVTSIIVDGYVFRCGTSFSILVYKDGALKKINDAYDIGWLTKDDIAYLAGYHKYADNWEIPINTQPNLKPGELDEETMAMFSYIFHDWFSKPDVPFPKIYHYGNYDGAIVFFAEIGSKEEYTEETVKSGEIISCDRPFYFFIYQNGRLELNSSKLLHMYISDEAISEIVKYHNSRK